MNHSIRAYFLMAFSISAGLALTGCLVEGHGTVLDSSGNPVKPESGKLCETNKTSPRCIDVDIHDDGKFKVEFPASANTLDPVWDYGTVPTVQYVSRLHPEPFPCTSWAISVDGSITRLAYKLGFTCRAPSSISGSVQVTGRGSPALRRSSASEGPSGKESSAGGAKLGD